MYMHSNSILSPGTLLLCVGVVILLMIPTFLKSSLNTKIDVPSEGEVSRLSPWTLVQWILVAIIGTETLLSLGRIYETPLLWYLAPGLGLLVTLPFTRKRRPPTPPTS